MSSDLPPGTDTVVLAAADLHGILRGKRIPAHVWPAARDDGVAVASVIVSWSPRCDLLPGVLQEQGWPDVRLTPLLYTLRAVPWLPGTAMVLCDMDGNTQTEGLVDISARAALERVLRRAAGRGYQVKIGFEVEFHLLDKATGRPVNDDSQCYGIARGAGYESVLRTMRQQLLEFDIPIESSDVEYGPGQIEVNIRFDDALQTADTAVLFRNAVREIAAQHGHIASFMAKITEDSSGSGLHLHHSLWRDGRNCFAHEGDLSVIGRHYLAGLQRHLADLSLFGSPTPNSMKRRVSRAFSPVDTAWDFDNRSTALRVITGADAAVRIEQRDGAADCNPYLAIAAGVAAGLDGVDHAREPSNRASAAEPHGLDTTPLPRTVAAAVAALQASELAPKVFGRNLLDRIIASAEYEDAYFAGRVTDLERARYLDLF